jgi:hypothetical protein
MPTKTDRILSYLPGTFQALPRPTALYSLVDAFGNELLQAENSLVAVMRSHWVDTADQGDEFIHDLESTGVGIANLYGLAPRDDETVEDFRAHLKRYVRTFLEGTPTVQGTLRVTAESLALLIADDYTQMDTWWTRGDDSLTTVVPAGNDAAFLLFSPTALSAQGQASLQARITGTTDLSGNVDLSAASKLSIAVDSAAAVQFDLATLLANPAAAKLPDIVAAINTALGANIAAASADGTHVILSSPTRGASSRIAVQDVTGDAAPGLLGLAPHTYQGAPALAATVMGMVDLSGGVDLSDSRYLRLLIDGSRLAEIDCAGPDPAHTSVDQIVAAINGALGAAVASHDGHFLTLTSPSTGFSSLIQFQSPAGQDATQTLFGTVNGIYTGKGPQPATVTGTRDLSHGVDLSHRSNIEIALDGGAHLPVNCAGASPDSTSADEIIAAINLASGKQVASYNGQFLVLTSSTTGPGSSIRFFTPATGDATTDTFGLAQREVAGSNATAASLAGIDVGGNSLDLGAQHLLQVAVDDAAPVTMDFWTGIAKYRTASLADIAAAINASIGSAIAAAAGQRLVLTSLTLGAASSVAVLPLENIVPRRFVTRAFVLNEAAQIVLGVFQQQAFGSPALAASVAGTVDLSRGVDLRVNPFLQLSIDDAAAKLIDCSAKSPRPRLALPNEIVLAVNTVLDPGGNLKVASTDGHVLFFTSPTVGASSRIEFQPVTVADASTALGLQPAIVFGHDATGVTFVGTVDLSHGVNLSAAGKIKLAIDGAAPVEIDCAGADRAHTSQAEIITRINNPLGSSIATPVGNVIALASPARGANTKIEFLPPSSGDATVAIFGIGPRSYHGADAVPPRISGTSDISASIDLSVAKFLQIGFDGVAPQTVDCSVGAADPKSVKPAEIVSAINAALKKPIASTANGRLVLTGPTAAASGKLALASVTSDGAFARLMGGANKITSGTDASPATIKGAVDLLAGVNLDERRILRLQVDGARPLDIDISGVQPDATFLEEIVARLNAVVPDLASASQDERLVLTSPTAGENSSLQVLPIRALEVLEFPASPAQQELSLKPGDKFSLQNGGAADEELTIQLTAAQGVAGAELVNRTTGYRIRVLDAIPAGGALRVWDKPGVGLRAQITSADGTHRSVPGSSILAGRLVPQAVVPFSGTWHLCEGAADAWARLELNNPQARNVTGLRARRRGVQGSSIVVRVSAAATPAAVPVTADGSLVSLAGRVQFNAGAYELVDGNNAVQAALRVGPGVALAAYSGQTVLVYGRLFSGDGNPPVMEVESIASLFDVGVQGSADDGSALNETYPAVTIGFGVSDPHSLCYQVLARPSQLLVAQEFEKASVLALPRGRSDWSFMAALGARFDQARFNYARFAGGPCLEPGVFDVSRFADLPPEHEAAVYAGGPTGPAVQVALQWTSHKPGSFIVNLPADLPENFGARFNYARFAQPGNTPEVYTGVVTEPAIDSDYIVTRINAQSHLVKAGPVSIVPLGWQPQVMPFFHPRAQNLTGGNDNGAAQIYLAESGVPGFIHLTALVPGKWGNTIEVTARHASPGRFDVTIGYEGARFENARQTVLAGKVLAQGEDPMPVLISEILKPRPVGVLQGKAAGVLAQVTRDQT